MEEILKTDFIPLEAKETSLLKQQVQEQGKSLL